MLVSGVQVVLTGLRLCERLKAPAAVELMHRHTFWQCMSTTYKRQAVTYTPAALLNTKSPCTCALAMRGASAAALTAAARHMQPAAIADDAGLAGRSTHFAVQQHRCVCRHADARPSASLRAANSLQRCPTGAPQQVDHCLSAVAGLKAPVISPAPSHAAGC